MYQDESAIYGLRSQARCITAVQADIEKHAFLVGTLSAKEMNEVHCIEFSEEDNSIRASAVLVHPGEVWSLSTCPKDVRLFFSVSNSLKEGIRTRLWRIPEASHEDSKGGAPAAEAQLEEVLELQGHSGPVKQVLWNPNEGATLAASLDSYSIRLWNLQRSESTMTADAMECLNVDEGGLTAGAWDPHHTQQFVSVNATAVRAWDLRSMKETQCIHEAHADMIRDIDYNPNKPYHVVTGGDDRLVKFWDLRKVQDPIKILARHSHWVCKVKYNRFHDQLVLTAGTDSSVNLWSVVSISSAPLGDLEDPANEREGDKLVKSYDEHEESVYSVAWSVFEAWIFASLSYDGRIVINHVPSAEKYKILL